ncbi:Wzz/FepE/Etk N-terminal domain-containing protein [Massilia phosphatilytica]
MEYNKASGAELDDPHGDEGLFDVLVVFLKNRRLIFGFPVIVGAITFAVSFAIPPTFRASTTILPPQQSQMGAAALLSQLGGAASMVASATGIKNPSDLYIGMLRSRTISDNLIGRFHLQSVYDVESLEQTRKESRTQHFDEFWQGRSHYYYC